MLIQDCVHLGSCPFGIVSIWDCVHPFGMVSNRNGAIRDCVFLDHVQDLDRDMGRLNLELLPHNPQGKAGEEKRKTDK